MTIAFPKPVRLSEATDGKRIFDTFIMAHAENGFFEVDDAPDGAVWQTIHRAAQHDHGAIIAIIDGPERIEAVLGLTKTKLWYAKDTPENYYWTDLLFYVHPLHRRTTHWAKLGQFARWWEEQCDERVMLNLLPREGFARRARVFSRIGKHVGSSYLVGEGAAAKLRINGDARPPPH